ncbi:MAG: hypothetical protein II826_05980 [Prevotella sp.]|nr:hypothetical protein [Prevotella sp.]
MKKVKAVAPYSHPGDLNFKLSPYEAWVKGGGLTAAAHYPPRLFHGLVFRWSLPPLWHDHREARLRFVEPVSVTFDTFPDTARYEVIPMVWDCWPRYFEKMCSWIKKHHVRTAIFTSSQTTERIQERFPELNVLYCPEAVDTSLYGGGKSLTEREIDVLEYGRSANVNLNDSWDGIRYVCTKMNGKFIFNNDQLHELMGDAKITIALPRSVTQPEVAGDIETLTQRYWENMLSRMVMIGHAPKELVELIGYNPVIELDRGHSNKQIFDIIANIDDFQSLVDKNRETALRFGDWTLRMKKVMKFLQECGYEI